MSIDKAVDSTVLDGYFDDIADAIRDKNGSNSTYTPAQMPQAIEDIPTGITPTGTISIAQNGITDVTNYANADVNVSGGGGGGGDKPVKFIDYDGTVVESYTPEEFAVLASMPANPTHSGLTAQGWNWTLVDAKTYVAKYGMLVIGQSYTTTSGKTEVDIVVDSARLSGWYVGLYPNGTVVIDWGDGSSTSTLTGTSLSTLKSTGHTYTTSGNYTITLNVTSGSCAIGGASTPGSSLVFNGGTNDYNAQRYYVTSVKAIRIGSGVTTFRDYAFSKMYKVESITIPTTVTSIGTYTFNSCRMMKSVTIPSGIASLGASAFNDMVVLDTFSMPKTMETIGNNCFIACYSLQDVSIPEGVTSIGTSAFNSCRMMKNVSIPDTVTTLNATVFQNCSALQSVIIPAATSFGASVFANCYILEEATFRSGATTIPESIFSSCYHLERVTVPNTVTAIGASAFSACYNLRSLSVPSAVSSIGQSAFSSCTTIEELDIPSSITTIGNSTFSGCNRILSLTVPSGVTSIGTQAFSGCSSLKTLTFLPTTPPAVSNTNTWSNIPSDVVVYVPNGKLTDYKNASNYSSISSKMVELPA